MYKFNKFDFGLNNFKWKFKCSEVNYIFEIMCILKINTPFIKTSNTTLARHKDGAMFIILT